jgi:hypothetical protein
MIEPCLLLRMYLPIGEVSIFNTVLENVDDTIIAPGYSESILQ